MPHAPVGPSGSIQIAYDDRGHGDPTLLFLPGWCAGRSAFDEVAARLAGRCRTVALDWRGHGGSSRVDGDFGSAELVEDALAVIEHCGAGSVVPVATAHAGWIAIELRRRLGDRVPRLVHIDWIVSEAPPPFREGLMAMRDPAHALAVRDALFAAWTEGVESAPVLRFVRDDMGSYPAEMWARAGREILGRYDREGSPLRALAALRPPPPTLHLYAQPPDEGYLGLQQAFARDHAWYRVERLAARSHFPTLEIPAVVAEHIAAFLSPSASR